jgi:hypothetical protein
MPLNEIENSSTTWPTFASRAIGIAIIVADAIAAFS